MAIFERICLSLTVVENRMRFGIAKMETQFPFWLCTHLSRSLFMAFRVEFLYVKKLILCEIYV